MMETGLIVKAIAGFYYCLSRGRLHECRGKGAFRNEEVTPLVGDRVEFLPGDTLPEEDPVPGGYVTRIQPRKNEFTRPPVANLDKLFIVAAVTEPTPSTLVIDKLTTVCEYKEIEPVIVITKTDLGDESRLRDIYVGAGYRVICLSNRETENFDEVREELRGCISAFAGNTGVGKSSLINNLCPSLSLETAHISKKLGRGKHTTRHVELYPLPGLSGYVADTPGFGTMELAQYEIIHKEQLQYCFREFAPFVENCRFTGCSHTVEKGCAVLEGLREGKLSASRHESYAALYAEAKQIKDWER